MQVYEPDGKRACPSYLVVGHLPPKERYHISISISDLWIKKEWPESPAARIQRAPI
jgi:hypothetical protein